MNEMVERVAAALFRGRGSTFEGSIPWEQATAGHKELWYSAARDAIRAEREPTKAVLEAIEDVLKAELGGLHDSAHWSKGWSAEIWRAAIDAALDT